MPMSSHSRVSKFNIYCQATHAVLIYCCMNYDNLRLMIWLVHLNQGSTIPYQYDPFWKGKWCPAHSSDGTLKCCSCNRLNPRGEEWVTELDGRTVCLDCLSSLVRDTPDAQPLYDQVSCRHITVFRLASCLSGLLSSLNIGRGAY